MDGETVACSPNALRRGARVVPYAEVPDWTTWWDGGADADALAPTVPDRRRPSALDAVPDWSGWWGGDDA